MSKASFRNAPVAALIYEFLYDVYRMIEVDRSSPLLFTDEKKAPLGVFTHHHISQWEWSTSILTEVGAIKPVEPPHLAAQRADGQLWDGKSAYYTPVMTLEACQTADYSAYETFDNYCYAMFTLSQHDWAEPGGFASPRFIDAVAAKDDIFEIDASSRLIHHSDRFNEKVMTRWREMEVREFRVAF